MRTLEYRVIMNSSFVAQLDRMPIIAPKKAPMKR